MGQLVASLTKLSNLLRAGDIRLVGTTCSKSDEVVKLVTCRRYQTCWDNLQQVRRSWQTCLYKILTSHNLFQICETLSTKAVRTHPDIDVSALDVKLCPHWMSILLDQLKCFTQLHTIYNTVRKICSKYMAIVPSAVFFRRTKHLYTLYPAILLYNLLYGSYYTSKVFNLLINLPFCIPTCCSLRRL